LKETYYSILSIAKNATTTEIKKAYHKKALKAHPDKGGSADEFRKVQEAYEVLHDNGRRSVYDTTI